MIGILLTKEVEITIVASNVKYYENLGYKIPMRKSTDLVYKQTGKKYVYDLFKKIKVKVKDLPNRSNAKVEVECDNCKKRNIISYANYCISMENGAKYYCNKCFYIKSQATQLEKYGDKSYRRTDECKEKIRKTNLERYGVEFVSQAESVKEKCKKTNLKKYGFTCSFQNEDVKRKYRENCLKKYGVEYTLQLPEVREKIINTLYENNSQKSSTQQRYLNQLYGGELNYPIKYFSADICFPDEKIIIEYDGGGHLLNVETGRETFKEYEQKEIIRNNILKRAGYRQIHIISSTDKLPSDKILLQMLSNAKEYFNTTIHTWIEYNIDTSIMRNADNMEGVFFNYGNLRRIYKSMLDGKEVC